MIFSGPSGFMCVLALLLVWYYGMELIPFSFVLLLLSVCNLARGQEETSTLVRIRLLQVASFLLCPWKS